MRNNVRRLKKMSLSMSTKQNIGALHIPSHRRNSIRSLLHTNHSDPVHFVHRKVNQIHTLLSLAAPSSLVCVCVCMLDDSFFN